MKRFLSLSIILFLLQVVIAAAPDMMEFDIIFNKQGKSGVSICEATVDDNGTLTAVDENAPLDKIEFPIYDNNPESPAPSTSFGIVWNVYSGSTYSLSVSAHAADGNSGNMLVATSDDGKIDYLNYEIKINPLSGMTGSKTFSGVGPHEFNSGHRDLYTLVTGQAVVTLTIDTTDRDSYLGDYKGSISFVLTTDE